jgi:uncharacterized protein with HEPN domain
MSDDHAHALDILRAAGAITRFMDRRTQQSFFDDDLLQSAVLYQFTVLGEACRRVSADFRSANPGVDWFGITGFRNRIVHNYDDVDLDVVWDIARTDLPALITVLDAIVPEEPPDGEEG